METRRLDLGILPSFVPSRFGRASTRRDGALGRDERRARRARSLELEIGNDPAQAVAPGVADDARDDVLGRPRRVVRHLRHAVAPHAPQRLLLGPALDRLPVPRVFAVETARVRRHLDPVAPLLVALVRVHVRVGLAARQDQDAFGPRVGFQEVDGVLARQSDARRRHARRPRRVVPETATRQDGEPSVERDPARPRRVRPSHGRTRLDLGPGRHRQQGHVGHCHGVRPPTRRVLVPEVARVPRRAARALVGRVEAQVCARH